MLRSLVVSVRGLWIRPEQSERVHDQNSPASSTAAQQEGARDRALAADEEQVRVDVEDSFKAERCGGDGELAGEDPAPVRDQVSSSQDHRRSSVEVGEGELQLQQEGQRLESDESEIARLDSAGNSSRSSTSSNEICRVCQQPSEEPLIVLGCACRGGLAKAHRSCIDAWFVVKGSNKCEVCQEIATNVQPPLTQPGQQFWVWRMGARRPPPGRQRATVRFQPLWAALMILIAGLLFDILISIFLGASALPVNIIIGILIVLGIGTMFRLILECWRAREIRRLQRTTHLRANPAYQSNYPAEQDNDPLEERPEESPSHELVQLRRPSEVYAIVI